MPHFRFTLPLQILILVAARGIESSPAGGGASGSSPAGGALGGAPNARPPPSQRKFNSTAIDALIDSFVPRFLDSDLATIFSNALPNSLDTTVVTFSSNDSFIITGDM